MATPIHGVPNYTSQPTVIAEPITAFYTKRDGVVDWQACLDHTNPHADNIEVDSSHVGVTLDPRVWLEIAHRLA